jgi:hypothetical protein
LRTWDKPILRSKMDSYFIICQHTFNCLTLPVLFGCQINVPASNIWLLSAMFLTFGLKWINLTLYLQKRFSGPGTVSEITSRIILFSGFGGLCKSGVQLPLFLSLFCHLICYTVITKTQLPVAWNIDGDCLLLPPIHTDNSHS